MPADEKMPPQPATMSLPAVTDRALLEDLTRVVRNIADNVGEVKQEQQKHSHKLDGVDQRLASLEGRVVVLETAPVTFVPSVPPPPALTSARVRAMVGETTSQMDMEHDAQLAQERAAREELAKKVDALTVTQETQLAILSRLDKVTSNPLVKTFATALATALMTWAASKGLR